MPRCNFLTIRDQQCPYCQSWNVEIELKWDDYGRILEVTCNDCEEIAELDADPCEEAAIRY